MADRVGQQLGNYRLTRLLGRGGFADVYLGEHIYLKTLAAVKVLQTRLLGPDDLENFLKEARIIAQLSHPHIIRVMDFGVDGETPFLVMEYAQNGTLRQNHPKGTILPLTTITAYINQAADALLYAHDERLIHRDIKPENMLLGRRYEILLSDFGLATIAHRTTTQNTQEIAGTAMYMAPEQFRGKPHPASDQYALGIITYEWLCGEPPFTEGDFLQLGFQHSYVLPLPLHNKIPSLSPMVEQVVMTALAKDPKQRFGSVQAFANALEQASQPEQPSIVKSVRGTSPSPLRPLSQPELAPPTLPSPSSPHLSSQPELIPPTLPSPSPPLPLLQPELTPSTLSSETLAVPFTASTPPVNPPSPPPETRWNTSANSSLIGRVPSQKKGPQSRFILATIALLVVLIGGSIYSFTVLRGNNAQNSQGTTTGATTSRNEGTGSSSSPIANPSGMKVALVTDIGGLNDNGFNHLAYTGYQKAERQYSFKEEIIQTQSQNDYVTNLTQAAQAADLVIAVGFLMQTPLDQVAKQFPSKKFGIIDGCAIPAGASNCEALPNVAPLFFKEQEAGCLVGAIAAQMEVDGKAKISKLLGKNTISAVGGLSIPPVNRYIAGYKYCALKVDPSITVLVDYSQDFTNTAKCKDVALSQINQHSADIIFQVAGGCGVGALDAANGKGIFGIGVDADQSYLYPSVITSALKRVDVAVYDTIDSFQKGNYTNNPPKFDLNHDGVGYAPVSSDVPADAKAKAEDFANQIKSGSLTPPENIP